MRVNSLFKDPYNIIITGVGGQGNVTASRILGDALVKHFVVTTGETFGVSQRGGSVMSHMRVSVNTVWSPQIPRGGADLIIALEPGEAVRTLKDFGNTHTKAVVNTRCVYPVGVTAGRLTYPSVESIKKAITQRTAQAWFIDATEIAFQNLKNPILGNAVMLGAVVGLGVVPVDKKDFIETVCSHFPEEKAALNVQAFTMGCEMVNK